MASNEKVKVEPMLSKKEALECALDEYRSLGGFGEDGKPRKFEFGIRYKVPYAPVARKWNVNRRMMEMAINQKFKPKKKREKSKVEPKLEPKLEPKVESDLRLKVANTSKRISSTAAPQPLHSRSLRHPAVLAPFYPTKYDNYCQICLTRGAPSNCLWIECTGGCFRWFHHLCVNEYKDLTYDKACREIAKVMWLCPICAVYGPYKKRKK